ALTDKYWMVALLPAPDAVFDARTLARNDNGVPHYQTDVVAQPVVVQAGETAAHEVRIYAGAKDLDLLNRYAKDFGYVNTDLAIDFGIWHLLSKPMYIFFHFLAGVIGHIGLAILVLTVCVRAV